MDVEQFKDDVREGRIDADRLVDLVVTSQRALQAAKQQLDQAKRRIEELEKKLGGSPTVKIDEPFSVREEERRQEARGKKRRKKNRPSRRGRVATAEKIARAARIEKVFPAGVPKNNCKLSHTRPIWRLEEGRAVLVAYEIYRGPKNQYGKIPGAMGRSGPRGCPRDRNRRCHWLSGLRRRAVVRQSVRVDELLSRPEAEEVASRRVAESVVAALGKRVRYAVHAAGEFGATNLRSVPALG